MEPILLIGLHLLFFNTALLSQYTIQGKVTDENGTVLAGASVLEKTINAGTTTKEDGTFSTNVSSTRAILIVSYIGYQTTEVPVNNQLYITIRLIPATANLDSVVVIGYGTAKKKDLTGAVSSVSAKDFNKGIYASPDQLIQGKVSGLQITYNNGTPGGMAVIKIRGNSAIYGTGQPLFVIDGVPLDGRALQEGSNPLNFINPGDIASIDVLKDASATAIYGSRAAYGVIIITTKKGQTGKASLKLDASVGVSSVLKKIRVLNASEYRDAINYYNVSDLNDKGGSADALDEVLQNGLQQNYTVSVTGGHEDGKYSISTYVLQQEGIIKNTDFKKYGLDLSSNFRFLDSKKLGLDINLISSQHQQNAPFPDVGAANVVASALQWNPTNNLRQEDGSLNIFAGDITNPLAITELVKNNFKVTTILASISPYYRFTPWLDYKLLLSVNYNSSETRSSGNQILFYPYNPRGYAAIANNELITQQITHTLHFNKKIYSNLNLDATAGYEYTKFDSKGYNMSTLGVGGQGFGNFGLDYTDYIQYGSSDPSERSIYSYAEPLSLLQSFFGRTILNYQDKYLITGTLRADGSSKFGENNKYGYFPSFAAAWNIYQESFFEVDFINSLKIRAGWGKTGNQEFPTGSSQPRYSFGNSGFLFQANNPNPDLKWQSDQQYNLGIDFSIFNNRISGTLDYFNKSTTDLLYPSKPIQPVPPNAPVTWINLNGKIINKGFEALINAVALKGERFNWNISANATFLSNNVKDMPAPIQTGYLQGGGVSDASVEVIQNGLPMNAFYTKKFLGMDKQTGFATFADDGNSFYYVGNPNPKILLGFSTTVGYKKFSLNANMYGAFGQSVYYNTLMNVINVSNINSGRNIALSVYNDLVKESFANPVTPSSRFIYKGNYLKMTNLTISYAAGNIGRALKKMNVSVTAQNLFMITKYPGFDPEANYDPSSTNTPSLGIDFAQYPTARIFFIGISFLL